jgi:glycosyltransferase involved in cell wall biosynthesis
LGARFAPIQLARTGLNPFADALSMRRMEALFRLERPDIVLAYTIKPVVYGVPAARRAGVPRVYALITGLGAAFHTPGLKGWGLGRIARWLYRRALPLCDTVFVQNQGIAALFVGEKMVGAEKITVVPGSGVDTDHFAAAPFPTGVPVFLLLARLLRDKGIFEFVEAARRVKARLPQARFYLVGDFDPNPAGISPAQIDRWREEGLIQYFAFQTDVRPVLAECTTYVLPSYHEGMPRSVLEAMATGRAVITTDVMGCRDTIFGVTDCAENPGGLRQGENGLLVPARTVPALADAMILLGSSPEMAVRMGRCGRELAEQHFAVHKVNRQMLKAMELLSTPQGAPRRPLP